MKQRALALSCFISVFLYFLNSFYDCLKVIHFMEKGAIVKNRKNRGQVLSLNHEVYQLNEKLHFSFCKLICCKKSVKTDNTILFHLI